MLRVCPHGPEGVTKVTIHRTTRQLAAGQLTCQAAAKECRTTKNPTRRITARWCRIAWKASLALIASIPPLLCQSSISPPAGRPILFVPGICAQAADWTTTSIASQVSTYAAQSTQSQQLYADTNIYEVYYDGSTVRLINGGMALSDPTNGVPQSARFFAMDFYADISVAGLASVDPLLVAQVSILNKADEVAEVIQAIASHTHVKDVIVVAHSMGGLDTRAYMEGLAVPASQAKCIDDGTGGNSTGTYTFCQDHQIPYGQDIAKLITLDTPHSGAVTANIAVGGLAAVGFEFNNCVMAVPSPLNVRELQESEYVVSSINQLVTSAPGSVPIVAIQSYTDMGLFWLYGDDGVVTKSEQSVNTIASPSLSGIYQDVSNDAGLDSLSTGCLPPVLHLLSCLSKQSGTEPLITSQLGPSVLTGQGTSITVTATLDGTPWPTSGPAPINYTITGPVTLVGTTVPYTFQDGPGPVYYNIPTGSYTLTYNGGGPTATFSVSPTITQTIASRNWNPTFTLAFKSLPASAPVVATQPAANVSSGNPVLVGTVNPGGAAASAWFEWSTDPTLATHQISLAQSLPAGTVSVQVTTALPDLEPGTVYYYQLIASGAGGASVPGGIMNFTTLPALPAPTLLAPQDYSLGAQFPVNFVWTPVDSATSYRVMIATNASALPTDPTTATCGAGCVWFDTPLGTADVPPLAVLGPQTTYYWEVHARSPSQYGTWSTISQFTTSAATGNDFSVTVSPLSQTANGAVSVTYQVATTTTSGSPQPITLSASNGPPGSTVSFSPTSVTSGSTSALTINTSSSTPSATYTVAVTAAGNSATHSTNITLAESSSAGNPSVTFSPSTLAFGSQTLYTNSPSQLVTYRNVGSAPLQVLSIVGDNNFLVPSPAIMTLPAGTSSTFSVVFDPSVTGQVQGKVSLYYVGVGSPAILNLSGYGVPASPTSSTIQVNGTLDGSALPSYYGFDYTMQGPSALSGAGPATFTATPGNYTIAFAGSPSYLSLSSVTPSPSQAVLAGGTITFTMNFTAPNDFYPPFFGVPSGGMSPQIVPAGQIATYEIGMPYPPPGNASSPITLSVSGVPPGGSPQFNPNPMFSGASSSLTVATSSNTAQGAFTLGLVGTNSSGLLHQGGSSSLLVTHPLVQVARIASVNSSGVQANGGSTMYSPDASLSADGRFAAFTSSAGNLATGASSGGVFVHDFQTGVTTLVSISNGGVPADSGCGIRAKANGIPG